MTGLSGAGKTTISNAFAESLKASGITCAVLDGDELRKGLNANLSFSPDDRKENVRRIAHVAKLLTAYVEVVIVAVISPTRACRELARGIIGEHFFEIFVDAPISICESRDPKGLYKQVRAGRIGNFTGLSDTYEPPSSPSLHLQTDRLSVDEEIRQLKELLYARTTINAARQEQVDVHRLDIR